MWLVGLEAWMDVGEGGGGEAMGWQHPHMLAYNFQTELYTAIVCM